MRIIRRGLHIRVVSCALSLALATGPILSGAPVAHAAEATLEAPAARTATATETPAPDLDTPTAKHWRRPDGSLRAELYTGPVQFRDAEGSWRPIDTDLVPGAALGDHRTASASTTVTFRAPGNGRPVAVSKGAASVEMRLVGGLDVPHIALGDSALFRGVVQSTDLRWRALADGVKETTILNSASAPATFTFELALDRARLVQVPGGRPIVVDQVSGESLWELQPVWAQDASETPCTGVREILAPAGDGLWRITYSVPPTWLSAPERVFPVEIDPTLLTCDADTYVSEPNPTSQHSSDTELRIGRPTGGSGDDHRALLRFDTSSLTGYTNVQSATFSIYAFQANVDSRTYLGRPDAYWNPNVTWNSAPGFSAYSDQRPATLGVGWWDWNVAGAVQDWIDTGTWSPGLQLYQAEDESQGTYHYKRFRSQNYSDSSYRPRVNVVMADPNPSVSLSGLEGSYVADDSDVVTVTATVSDPYYQEYLTALHLGANYAGGTGRGRVSWFAEDPGSGYDCYTLDDATFVGSPSGTSDIRLLSERCSSVDLDGSRQVTFVFTIKGPWGNVQNNHYDWQVDFDADGVPWSSGWRTGSGNFDILPGAPDVTAHPVGLDWFTEPDANGDGVADSHLTTSTTAGRGRVSLDWPQEAASSYRVYLHDGNTYREVADLQSVVRTWNSAGVYTSDSAISALATGFDSNPLFRGSPSAASCQASIGVSGVSGTGVLITDGTYLYTRSYDTQPGPTSWRKITTTGTDLGQVGIDYSSKRIRSGFYKSNYLYNGYLEKSQGKFRVTGVHKNSAAGQQLTTTFVFESPPLQASSGDPFDPAGGGNMADVLLATDGNHVYSVANHGDSFRIRKYSSDGDYIDDYDVWCEAYSCAGVISETGYLNFVEWSNTDGARVTKVHNNGDSWSVEATFTLDQATTRANGGCWQHRSQNMNLFFLGALDQGSIYRHGLTGLDLRDDPSVLYAKTAGTSMDNRRDWSFAVVAANSAGEATTVIPVQLPDRTISPNEDAPEVQADLGEAAGTALSVGVADGALSASVSDLEIASWGPPAGVSRTYSSDVTASTCFAPGWRFDFESCVNTRSGWADYTDAAGVTRSFVATQGCYLAPTGFSGTLETTTGGFALIDRDRTVTRFDGEGRLDSVTDRNGNAVTYDGWGTSDLTITAANGQEIVVDFNCGNVDSVTYSTADGTRRVSYDTTQATVTYWPGTDDEHTVDYTYSDSVLTSVTSVEDEASWGLVYSGAKVAMLTLPGYSESGAAQYLRTDVAYGSSTATVTRYGEVDGTEDTAIDEIYQLDAADRLSARSDPATGSVTRVWSRYEYSPEGVTVVDTSPAGIVTRASTDLSGNTIAEISAADAVSTFVYDSLDRCTSETDERGSTTDRTYDGEGNLTSEERVLNAVGQRARTAWTHDDQGRVLSEARRLTDAATATVVYSDFASSGEPRVTTRRDVVLATGTVDDLVECRAFDAFGNVIEERDAAGVTTTVNTYSPTTRLHALSSEDASHVVTHRLFDALGRETETSRSAGATSTDLVRRAYDALGRVTSETAYLSETEAGWTVNHVFDTLGREVRIEHSVEGNTVTRYDARGSVRAQWGPAASAAAIEESATRVAYDLAGRETYRWEPGASSVAASATATTYDAAGRVLRVTEPSGDWTENVYDAAGDVVAETSADGASMTTYDLAGRAISKTDEADMASSMTYDLADRLTSTFTTGTTTVVYNATDAKLSETEPDGVVKAWSYDMAGRTLTSAVATAVTGYAYDSCGRTALRSDADSGTTEYSFDEFGRVASERQRSAAGVLARQRTYGYDTLSRVVGTTETVAGVSTTWVYAGTAQSHTTAQMRYPEATVTILYSNTGEEITRTADTGVSSTRAVTSRDDGRRATGWDWVTPETTIHGSAAFAADGRMLTYTGAGMTGSALVGYDGSGRKDAENVPLAYGGTISDTFAYGTYGGSTGRLTYAEVDNIERNYQYDSSGELLEVDLKSTDEGDIDFELSSNRVSERTVRRDGPDVVTEYTHDSRGRRISETCGTTVTAYGWNEADRLTTLTVDVNTVRSLTATFTYDTSGQRTASRITTSGGSRETAYVYEGLTLLSVVSTDSAGTMRLTYLHDESLRPYAIAATADGTTTLLGLVTTSRGDVVGMTDASGTAVASWRYDAWGNPTSSATRASTLVAGSVASRIAELQILRYAGYAFDGASGLYYLSQRYYDPTSFRFISKDPAKADGEASAYQYCGGDPVGKVDPSGLAEVGHNHTPSGSDSNVVMLTGPWCDRWKMRVQASLWWINAWNNCPQCHQPDRFDGHFATGMSNTLVARLTVNVQMVTVGTGTRRLKASKLLLDTRGDGGHLWANWPAPPNKPQVVRLDTKSEQVFSRSHRSPSWMVQAAKVYIGSHWVRVPKGTS